MVNNKIAPTQILIAGITLLIYTLSLTFHCIGGVFNIQSVNLLITSIILLNIYIAVFVVKKPRRHITLIIFTLSFNLLMMGKVYVSWIKSYNNLPESLSADSYPHLYSSINLLFISLLVIVLTYQVFALILGKREDAIDSQTIATLNKNQALTDTVRKISQIAFFVSAVGAFSSLAINIVFILRVGYMQSFVEHAQVPAIISIWGTFFLPSFVLFLATKPSKKQLIIPMGIYALGMGLTLLTGRRNMLVRDLLMLVIYIVMRDDLRGTAKKFITKTIALISALIGVVLLYALNFINIIRGIKTEGSSGIISTIVNFISSQGVSFRVVVKTIESYPEFDRLTAPHFLFYPIELYMNNNIFSQFLFGTVPIAETQTESFAQGTFNLGHKLTYMFDPSRYLDGGGFGTAYIAESYLAFNIVGVILVSIMLGALIRYSSSILTRTPFVAALGLILIRYLVYVPRNFAFGWVFEVFNFTYIIFFMVVYFFALILNKWTK